MDWSGLIDVAGTAASVGSGGLFGIIGAGIGQISKYFQTKAERAFQKEKWAHALELQKLNMQAKAQENEQELSIVSQKGAWDGLTESIKADAVVPASGWAATIKVLFRPFLTVLQWSLAAWVFNEVVSGSLKTWLTQVEIKDIIKYMIYTIFFCASTSGTWWFGERAMSPPNTKNR